MKKNHFLERFIISTFFVFSSVFLIGCMAETSADLSTYTITYSGNGNSSGSVPTDSTTYLNREIITVLGNTGNLYLSNYVFIGWNTSADGSGTNYTAGNTLIVDSANITLYAQWQRIVGTVTYIGNGNSSGSVPSDSTTYFKGDSITVLGNTGSLSLDHYDFIGWNTSADGSGISYSEGDTLVIDSADITLYAQWEHIVRTISYNSNGGEGTMATLSGYDGSIVNLDINTFTRSGYYFTGWATSSTGSVAYSDEASITLNTADITLYAQWQHIVRTISYNSNGGEGTMATLSGYDGSIVNLNVNTFTRSGYYFTGWATSSTGSVTYSDGASITLNTADITLYAQWEHIVRTISYNSNDGEGTMANLSGYDGSTVNLDVNTFTRSGYYFAGWATSSTGSVAYSDEASITLDSGNLTLYAIWKVLLYTVTYNSNGGTGVVSDSYTDNESITLRSNLFSLEWYDFAGWSTSSTGSVTYSNGETINITSNIDLFAVWEFSNKADMGIVLASANSDTVWYDVQCDENDNIYAAGFQDGSSSYSYGSGVNISSNTSYENSVLVKYNENGAAQWAVTVKDGGGESHFNRIAIDSDGYIYACGYQTGRGTYNYGDDKYGDSVTLSGGSAELNAVIIKYSSNGIPVWGQIVKATVSSDNSNRSSFTGIAIDEYGDVYACGYCIFKSEYSFGNNITFYDAYDSTVWTSMVVKYDSDGNAQWAETPSEIGAMTVYNDIAVKDGHVYLAGYQYGKSGTKYASTKYVYGGSTSYNGTLICYNIDGVFKWGKTATDAPSATSFSGICVDNDGNIYIAGYQNGTSSYTYGTDVTMSAPYTGKNGIIIKYNSSGTAKWVTGVTTGSQESNFRNIYANNDGYIMTVGNQKGTDSFTYTDNLSIVTGSSNSNGIMLICDTDGNGIWGSGFNGSGDPSCTYGVTVDSKENFIVSGYQSSTDEFNYGNSVTASAPSSENNAVIIKYTK